MRRMMLGVALGGALLWCPLAVDARPHAAAPPTNDDCMMCHSDPAAARPDGRSMGVDPDRYAASIHGLVGLACVDCHADLATVTDWQHAERLQPAQCGSCHQAALAAYDTGIHAQARRAGGNLTAATCADCHGAHDIKPSSDPDSRTHHLRLLDTCGHCHGNEEIIKRGRIAIGNVVELFKDSIHGRGLIRSGLSVAPTCTDCHGSHDIRRKADPASLVFRKTIPNTCGKCHQGIGRQYWESVHGTQVAKDSPLAPVCSNCHTAHEIQRSDAAAWQLDVVNECGTCHEQSARTFRDTFHGKVTSLGFTRVATCANCHGAHAIFAKSDPRSTVSSANVQATCRQCHAGATARFAQYDPHADPRNRDRSALLYYTSQFMRLLLGGVFTFFGLHATLWLGREAQLRVAARRRLRRRDDRKGGQA